MFIYVGCHYVDLVAFITGHRPSSVSVYGIVDKYPNGRQGYLWTDGRVIWDNGAESKRAMVAVDLVHTGVGDTVLVVYEGGSARQCMKAPEVPVSAAAAGFVDSATGYANA